jgi:hypothetical protein
MDAGKWKDNHISFLATLIALIVLFFHKVVFMGYDFFFRDIFSHSYPAKFLFAQAIKNGEFPLWNPYLELGLPYVGDLSNQALYFFNVLYLFLPNDIATNSFILVHFILCATFTYFLVYILTDNKFIGFLGAIIFTFSGYNISITCNLEYLSTIAWLPAIFWSYYGLLQTKKPYYFLLLSTFLSMLIFSGDPMSYYFICGFLVLACLFEIRDKQQLKTVSVITIGAIIISLGLAAIQLLPAIELSSFSIRSGGLSFVDATSWSVHPVRLIEFLFPFYFGYHFDLPQYWGVFMFKDNFSDLPWVESFYIGIIPLFLAIAGLVKKPDKLKIYWLSITMVSLILALGKYTFIYKLLYDFLPFFSSFRYPEKLILFVSFGICILASISLKDILDEQILIRPQTRRYFIIFLALLALALLKNYSASFDLNNLATTGAVTEPFLNAQFRYKILYLIFIFGIFFYGWYKFNSQWNKKNITVLYICLFTFLDLFFINIRAFEVTTLNFYSTNIPIAKTIQKDWNQPYPPRLLNSLNPKLGLLKDYLNHKAERLDFKSFSSEFYGYISYYYLLNLKPNRAVLYNINNFYTTSPLKLKVVSDLYEEFELKAPDKIINLFEINYIMEAPALASRYTINNSARIFKKGTISHESLLKSSQKSRRVLIVPEASYYSTEEELKKAIITDDINITRKLYLIGKKPEQKSNPFKFVLTRLKILDYKFNSLKIKTYSSDDSYLLLLDAYLPGWQATIDGQKAEVLKANLIYRAVKLPSGKHEVVFKYEPESFKTGLLISFITFILILVGTIFIGIFHQKESHKKKKDI